MLRLGAVLWLVLATALGGVHSGAQAQPTATPAPAVDLARGNPEDPFVVGVYGDSLAEGIWGGIYRKLQRERGWTIVRRARHSTGFSRSNYYNWFDAIDGYLAQDDPDLAIVAIGLNDMQPFYLGGRRIAAFGNDAWMEAYSDAVRTFVQRFEDSGVPVIWIGLPVMRPGTYADQMILINSIFERVVPETGATFVPLYDLTLDENGEYSAYLPDADGRNRLMRADDGIHFTSRGYDLLAGHIFESMVDVLAAETAPPRPDLPETASTERPPDRNSEWTSERSAERGAGGGGLSAPIELYPGGAR